MRRKLLAVFGIIICGASLALAADPVPGSTTLDKFHPVLTTGQHALVRDGHLFFESGNTRTPAPEGEYVAVDGRVFIVGKKGAILTSRMR